MPELPEVETYVRSLRPLLLGKTTLSAEVFWPRIIAAPAAPLFAEMIRGRRFASIGRRGKYMLMGLDSGESLVVHLRMTGELRLLPSSSRPPPQVGGRPSPPAEADASSFDKHTHLRLHLDSGEELRYRDTRKFGRIWLVADAQSVVAKLGPEPLSDEFGPDSLAEALRGRKANIKSLLLNQSVLAGVGNIYADEALFRAGILPSRAGGALRAKELTRLHRALQEVLRAGIEAQGSSLQDYAPPTGGKGSFQEEFQVFRRGGLPCFHCGAAVTRIVLAQRSTHYCPSCQE